MAAKSFLQKCKIYAILQNKKRISLSLGTFEQERHRLALSIDELHGKTPTPEHWRGMVNKAIAFLTLSIQDSAVDICRDEMFRKAAGYISEPPRTSGSSMLISQKLWDQENLYTSDEVAQLTHDFDEFVAILERWCQSIGADEDELYETAEAVDSERKLWLYTLAYRARNRGIFKRVGDRFAIRKAPFVKLAECFPQEAKPIPHIVKVIKISSPKGEDEKDILREIRKNQERQISLQTKDRIDEYIEETGENFHLRTSGETKQERAILAHLKSSGFKNLRQSIRAILFKPEYRFPDGYPADDSGIKACYNRIYRMLK